MRLSHLMRIRKRLAKGHCTFTRTCAEHSKHCRECLTEGGCVITARTTDPDKACGLRRARVYHIVIRECLTE